MKKCPFCAELIQDEATICRFCNRELPFPSPSPAPTPPQAQAAQPSGPQKKTRVWLVLLIVLVLCLSVCLVPSLLQMLGKKTGGSQSPSTSGSSFGKHTGKPAAELEKTYQELWSTNLLKKVESNNFFYVDPMLWDSLNIDGKRGICNLLADYVGIKTGDAWVEIYDYQTGKKLAKLNSWGFEVY